MYYIFPDACTGNRLGHSARIAMMGSTWVARRAGKKQASAASVINASGTTIVMVTHDPDLAQRAHRRVHIRDGRIGAPQVELAGERA